MRRIGYRVPDTACSVGFAAVNRDKRGLTLDLHTDDGRRRLLALLAGADVFVENWRPGVAEREWLVPLRGIAAHDVVPTLKALLSPVTGSMTMADCLALLARNDIPAAEVLDLDGHLAHRQVRHNGTYRTYDEPRIGTMRRARYPGLGSRWSDPAPSTGAPGRD
jgi:crotonobetainyl-CoA:carnitine CoA-transferase CaiB-like acyl-CoA transferase